LTRSTIHVTTSGGLISAAFVGNIRELDTRRRGIELESFALPWAAPPLDMIADYAGARASYERALRILENSQLPLNHPHIQDLRRKLEQLGKGD
jgi:hypothetical protein